MGTLQAALDSLLQDFSKPDKIAALFLRKKLEEKGITLTDAQTAKIESSILDSGSEAIAIDIGDDQLTKLKPQLREGIKNLSLDMTISENDIEDLLANVTTAWSEIFPQLVEDLSELLLKQLRSDAASMLRDRKKDRMSFEKRLAKRWRKPLKLLEMFLAIALEAGDDFNREFRAKAVEEKNYIFEVLTRLHARACQLASEILVLLKSGHADGAHARWRSLHEVAVIGTFIESAGNETAERYLLHNAIESHRSACQYQQRCEQFGYEPISCDELNAMESACKHLVDRFGAAYKNEYGWAAAVIDKKKPSFRDIEENTRLERLRPYYRMASYNVHANPKSVFFKLGLSPDGPDILLAGPSNMGLADPGQLAAISLGQITVALLTTKTDIDRLVTSRILMELMDEIGREFVETQMILEEDGLSESQSSF